MPTPTDRRPVIVVVADDAVRRGRILDALGRWFANDYRMVAVEAGSELPQVARTLRDSGIDVALIIAQQHLEPEPATSLLGRIRDILPTSRRALLTGWEDAPPAAGAIARA